GVAVVAVGRRPADAHARLTGVPLRAGVAVVAGAAVGLGRIRADPCRRVAGAGAMTLIAGGANDRVGPDAGARLAGVALRAGVGVVAGGAVGLGRIGADAGRGVAGAGGVALVGGRADDGVRADAGARLAGVALRTGVAVIARRGVVGVHAPGGRVARI